MKLGTKTLNRGQVGGKKRQRGKRHERETEEREGTGGPLRSSSVGGEGRLDGTHPGDSGLLWLEGKQDGFLCKTRGGKGRAGLECLLTYTRLNDCGGREFALRDGQEPVQPHPANVGQSAVAEGGTDTRPGDPETKRGSRRDSGNTPNQG